MDTKKNTTPEVEDTDSVKVDGAEFDKAMDEAKNSRDTYTHKFSAPFEYEGNVFKELTFNFGALTAADSLAIENELAAMRKSTLVPEFSGEYMVRMAARACTFKDDKGRKLSYDAILTMPVKDYLSVRGMVRSFLLAAGS